MNGGLKPDAGGRMAEAGSQTDSRQISSFRDLRVYQAAMELQQSVFEASK
jgi:hypothetical protein